MLYLYILTIHDYYRPSSVVHIDSPFESAFVWIRACNRITDVVHVTGQQLSCLWQDSCCSCDRTTAVVPVTGQQLSCL